MSSKWEKRDDKCEDQMPMQGADPNMKSLVWRIKEGYRNRPKTPRKEIEGQQRFPLI